MPKFFDNALTRAQVALEQGIPTITQVDKFDFAEGDIKWIDIEFSFRTGITRQDVECSTIIPVHLIYNYPRLIEVMNYFIDGFIVDYRDGIDQSKQPINPKWYQFQTVSMIVEQLQQLDNSGLYDAFFTVFAKQMAGERIHYTQVNSCIMLALSVYANRDYKKNISKCPAWYWWENREQTQEFIRILFYDNPYFAECALEPFFKGNESRLNGFIERERR